MLFTPIFTRFYILFLSEISSLILLREGGPLPGSKSWLLSNTWKLLIQGDKWADKAKNFLVRLAQAENSNVWESRSIALTLDLQSWVLWSWGEFPWLSGRSRWRMVPPNALSLLSLVGFQWEWFWEVGRTYRLASLLFFSPSSNYSTAGGSC